MCPHCCGEILSLLNFLIANLDEAVFSNVAVVRIAQDWIEDITKKHEGEKTVS